MCTAGWPDPASLPTCRRHPVAPLGRHTRGGNDSHATPGGCSRRNPDGGAGRCRGRLRRGRPRRLRHRPQAGPDRVQQEHQAHEQHPARRPVRRPSSARDLAFQGNWAFVGNYNGFTIYDISEPAGPDDRRPGHLPRIAERHHASPVTCSSCRPTPRAATTPAPAPPSRPRRSPPGRASRSSTSATRRNPRYIKSVETTCGSHTHTLVPERRRPSTSTSRATYSSNATYPDCQPPHDRISIIKVPHDDPTSGRVVARRCCSPTAAATRTATRVSDHRLPRHHRATRARTSPPAPAWVTASSSTSPTPRPPRSSTGSRTTRTSRSGTRRRSTTTANKVVFTDELGGGGAATCNAAIGPNRGANGIYDIVGKATTQADLPQLLQDPAAPGRHRELRGPQRLADPGQGPGHHGPGLVPGRRLASGTSPTPPSRRRSPTSSAAR